MNTPHNTRSTPKTAAPRVDATSDTIPASTPMARQHSQSFYDAAQQHAARDDDGHAFVPDPSDHAERRGRKDDLAEELGEEFIASATSGEEVAMDTRDDSVPEETGGPFLVVDGEREFASGSDKSNPRDAEPEPFPLANARPATSRR